LPLSIQIGGIAATTAEANDQLWCELWVSLASLLRSYTAAHGLNQKEQAVIELGEVHILVHAADRWLRLDRQSQQVDWSRENGTNGTMQLTEHGKLKAEAGEEELDMQAEAWARELMQ